MNGHEVLQPVSCYNDWGLTEHVSKYTDHWVHSKILKHNPKEFISYIWKLLSVHIDHENRIVDHSLPEIF